MVNFDKDLEEIKTKLNNVKLSDETKNNLKIKMEEELNKPNIKEKAKNILFPRKLVATFACFVLLITSCVAFADEIESLVANIFSNTDKQVEEAIANGNYKEIDMEYVEHDGIGIKVDYIIQEDDTLCIAFNVKSEEEFDNIYFNKIEILNNSQIIYATLNPQNREIINIKYKKQSRKNTNILCVIRNMKIKSSNDWKINFIGANCYKSELNKTIDTTWSINLKD